MSRPRPFFSRDYYTDPRRRARSGLVRALAPPARRLGFQLEVASFYSPVPEAAAIPEHVWESRSELPGVEPFDLGAQIAWAEVELADGLAEFDRLLPLGSGRWEYRPDNGLFGGADAALLYAMIRRHRPARVIEVGAGYSTLVSAAAVKANRADGDRGTLVSCDPYAESPPAGAVEGLERILPVPAERLGGGELGGLAAGDMLFIDSSHTVRIGGDVIHLLCELVPRLPAGVFVHLHDIFLPYAYPREWVEHNRWYWAEQYLLQALLSGSERLEVIFASHAAWREETERLSRLIPSLDPAHPPHSFWMRTRSSS